MLMIFVVLFQVVSGPSLGINDISPTMDLLNFANEERSKFIAITILPDDLPENDEVFTIRLVSPAGGATLAPSGTESQLTVSGNDSPIRFADAMAQVDESAGAVVLTVYRGLLPNDIPVGPLNSIATVQYSTTSGTATAGTDFQTSSGTVVFSLGSTTGQISVPIINDTLPEGEETFTVTLMNPSSDSVLVSPQTTVVTIAVNDDAGGVVRFRSTTPVIISEDAETEAMLVIERTLGTVNDVSIAWSIQDTQGNLATTDFNPVSGTVTIPDGQIHIVTILNIQWSYSQCLFSSFPLPPITASIDTINCSACSGITSLRAFIVRLASICPSGIVTVPLTGLKSVVARFP